MWFKKIIKIGMRKITISCEDYISLLKFSHLPFGQRTREDPFHVSFPADRDSPIVDSWLLLAFQ